MTTTPAMPDLTAVIKWLENGCDPHEAVKELKHYQSKLQALATLQAQPAAVSDEPTEAQIAAGMRELFAGPKPLPSWEVTLKRVYQAMFALRPQAVPMTEDAQRQWRFIRDRLNTISMYQDSVGKFVEWFEAHHGITAPAGGEKQA